MTVRTVLRNDTTRTVMAIDHALAFDPTRPIRFGGFGSAKSRPAFLPALDALLGNAMPRAAIKGLRADRDRLADAYDLLLTAAQTAVIESRSSNRNPATPLAEALADLGQLPEPGATLHSLVPEAGAAWPRGADA